MADTTQQQAAIRAQILANPAAMQALAENAKKQPARVVGPGGSAHQEPKDVLKPFGIDLPGDLSAAIDPRTGDVLVNHLSWFQRNADWLLPVATIGGGAAIGTLAGGGGTSAAGIGSTAPTAASAGGTGAATAGAGTAATTAGTAGAVLPSTSTVGLGTLPAATPGISSSAAGIGAGTVAAKTGTSFWDKIAKVAPIVEAGTGIIGAKIGADANKAAADAQLKAAEEALAFQKDVYAQRQQQLAPAIGVGNASTVRMGELLGIPTPQGGYQPTTSIAPGGVPIDKVGSVSNIQTHVSTPAENATAQQGLVTMVSPDGKSERNVPVDQVAHYVQQGARLKNGQDQQLPTVPSATNGPTRYSPAGA